MIIIFFLNSQLDFMCVVAQYHVDFDSLELNSYFDFRELCELSCDASERDTRA